MQLFDLQFFPVISIVFAIEVVVEQQIHHTDRQQEEQIPSRKLAALIHDAGRVFVVFVHRSIRKSEGKLRSTKYFFRSLTTNT